MYVITEKDTSYLYSDAIFDTIEEAKDVLTADQHPVEVTIYQLVPAGEIQIVKEFSTTFKPVSVQ